MAHYAINKTMNEYADTLPADLYARTPKAVLAAIVVSLLSGGGDRFADAEFNVGEALTREWAALHAAGIVPQRPPKEG